jgi:hypothetical protein
MLSCARPTAALGEKTKKVVNVKKFTETLAVAPSATQPEKATTLNPPPLPWRGGGEPTHPIKILHTTTTTIKHNGCAAQTHDTNQAK